MPKLPSLKGNEIPPGVTVQTPSNNRPAVVVGYRVLDKVYEVEYDDGTRESLEVPNYPCSFDSNLFVQSKFVLLAVRTRCRTKFGLGVVTSYR